METKEIREFLAERPAPGPDWPYKLEELAAAALMVECGRIDGEFDEEERDEIRRAVMERFALDGQTAESLVRLAEKREEEVWHDWVFTETIRKSFDEYERLAVILKLWDVALADGDVHPFEERLISRIASELGISEEDVDRTHTIVLQRHRGLSGLTVNGVMRPSSKTGPERTAAKLSREKTWRRS
jgi:uncharacterized tellurite resistance protein B-like protein